MFVFKGADDVELFEELYDDAITELARKYKIAQDKLFPGEGRLSDGKLEIAHDFTMEAIYRARHSFKQHRPEYRDQDNLLDL